MKLHFVYDIDKQKILVAVGAIVAAAITGLAGFWYSRAFLFHVPQPSAPIAPSSIATPVAASDSIACREINNTFTTLEGDKNFFISRLVPVETNLASHLVMNDHGLLGFKHFNAGGALYGAEQKPWQRFGGRGPYYISEILEFAERNASVFPTTYLPQEINEIISEAGLLTSVGYQESWFLLANESCHFCEGTERQTFLEIKNPNSLRTIPVPAEFSPRLETDCPGDECGSVNLNKNTLTAILGISAERILFAAGETYVAFDISTGAWKKIAEADVPAAWRGQKAGIDIEKRVQDLLAAHGCLFHQTPWGEMLIVPHSFYIREWTTPEEVDILFHDPQGKISPWNLGKTAR